METIGLPCFATLPNDLSQQYKHELTMNNPHSPIFPTLHPKIAAFSVPPSSPRWALAASVKCSKRSLKTKKYRTWERRNAGMVPSYAEMIPLWIFQELMIFYWHYEKNALAL